MNIRTIDQVVAYYKQISMYNFTGEAFVIQCIYRCVLSQLRPLCFREIVESVLQFIMFYALFDSEIVFAMKNQIFYE